MDPLIKSQCMGLAADLTRTYRKTEPPFSVQPLIEEFGVAGVRERPLDRDACLTVESGRLFIDVNSMYPAPRRRLSIAHEIGHLIVNRCSPRGTEFGCEPEIEAFCTHLAASLLAPEWALRAYFERQRAIADWRHRIGCSTILGASSAFSISVDAMASRVFCDLDLVPGLLAVVWRYMENTLKPGSEKAFRVASAWHSKRGVFVPRNKTAPRDSVIARAFQWKGALSGIENLSLGTVRGTFRIEALGFGALSSHLQGSYAAALSLICPTS